MVVNYDWGSIHALAGINGGVSSSSRPGSPMDHHFPCVYEPQLPVDRLFSPPALVYHLLRHQCTGSTADTIVWSRAMWQWGANSRTSGCHTNTEVGIFDGWGWRCYSM